MIDDTLVGYAISLARIGEQTGEASPLTLVIDDVDALYRELLTHYPESPKASLARIALDGLKTR